MSQSLTQVAERRSGALDIARQAALVIGASLFVAVCAHIYLPLPGTPVPLTVQNLAVLLVGLSLGSRRGFLAMALYLAEGASGLPVFSPTGPGGIAQLIGPTAGYLIAYPFVAALAGFIFERGKPTFSRAAIAAISGEILLFASGISWLYVLTHSLARAISLGLYWFIFAEIMKVMLAAGAVNTWRRFFPRSDEADMKAPE
ncbi:MAG TPA: biotin transporter BioY [Terriglobales bacterium]|jgi:biotin transport system substrate-specific component|nr:biotin transporter BioY [Terriglobales bacterium]